MPSSCPICETRNVKRIDTVTDCPRCGQFIVSDLVTAQIKELEPDKRGAISHTIRRAFRHNQPITITIETLPNFYHNGLPSPAEQADDLLLWIGDKQQHQHSHAAYAVASDDCLGAWIGAALSPQDEALGWLRTQLASKRLFDINQDNPLGYRLTFDGWRTYEALKRRRVGSRTGFMAMKFGNKQVMNVFANCFQPAAERAGFKLRLVTDGQTAGLIDDHIRAGIIAAKFVVADLTHDSFGAYWEAGFAEGSGLHVFYTCEAKKWKKSQTHFDTNHLTTVIWDKNNLGNAGARLTDMIRATFPAEATLADFD